MHYPAKPGICKTWPDRPDIGLWPGTCGITNKNDGNKWQYSRYNRQEMTDIVRILRMDGGQMAKKDLAINIKRMKTEGIL